MKTHHMCLSVRGALMNWTRREYTMLRHTDGRNMTADEGKRALLDELAKGREVIPMGPACEGFDYSGGGCPGHEQTEGGKPCDL
jgi:hypothetical protein